MMMMVMIISFLLWGSSATRRPTRLFTIHLDPSMGQNKRNGLIVKIMAVIIIVVGTAAAAAAILVEPITLVPKSLTQTCRLNNVQG